MEGGDTTSITGATSRTSELDVRELAWASLSSE